MKHTGAQRAAVAKRAGVSESTVSRALSGSNLISEKTKERIRKAASELGYIPNKQAACFSTQKTSRLGFVVPVYRSFPLFSRAYFPAMLDGAVKGAEQRGYSITIIPDKKGDEFKDLPNTVKSREVDGLLMVITTISDPRIEELKNQEIPFVLINSLRQGCYSVDSNPLPGMKKAFEYMVEMDHRNIGYISGDRQYQNSLDRLDAFNQLAHEFKIKNVIMDGNFSRRSGYYCAGKFLNNGNPPSLIMTSSDREAIGVIDYCRDHNVSIPEQLSVIGFDNLDPAEFVTPTITTVDNPVTQTGEQSSKLLIDMIEGNIKEPVAKKLDTGFIVRQSSGKRKN
jgi:LacI family transcriptional regulator